MSGGAVVVWRGDYESAETNLLHAEAFDTRIHDDDEWDWRSLTSRHSLGWVTARIEERLLGFVNVVWDGLVHAWLQDLMVSADARGGGVGAAVVDEARRGARRAGCEWLHVDFDEELADFYLRVCGFEPARAGLMRLR